MSKQNGPYSIKKIVKKLLNNVWYIVEGAVLRTNEMQKAMFVNAVTVNSVTKQKVTALTIR